MNLNDYIPLALSTCNMRGRQLNLEHATIGMFTEAGEFGDAVKKEHVYGKTIDVVNIKEEVGDGLWYAALLCHVQGYPIDVDRRHLVLEDDGAPMSPFALSIALCGSAVAAAACVDMGEAHHDDLFNQFELFMGTLQLIADRYGFTLEEAADVNIAKLKKRYPDGFTAQAALNRDLTAERQVLEAGTDATNAQEPVTAA